MNPNWLDSNFRFFCNTSSYLLILVSTFSYLHSFHVAVWTNFLGEKLEYSHCIVVSNLVLFCVEICNQIIFMLWIVCRGDITFHLEYLVSHFMFKPAFDISLTSCLNHQIFFLIDLSWQPEKLSLKSTNFACHGVNFSNALTFLCLKSNNLSMKSSNHGLFKFKQIETIHIKHNIDIYNIFILGKYAKLQKYKLPSHPFVFEDQWFDASTPPFQHFLFLLLIQTFRLDFLQHLRLLLTYRTQFEAHSRFFQGPRLQNNTYVISTSEWLISSKTLYSVKGMNNLP